MKGKYGHDLDLPRTNDRGSKWVRGANIRTKFADTLMHLAVVNLLIQVGCR